MLTADLEHRTLIPDGNRIHIESDFSKDWSQFSPKSIWKYRLNWCLMDTGRVYILKNISKEVEFEWIELPCCNSVAELFFMKLIISGAGGVHSQCRFRPTACWSAAWSFCHFFPSQKSWFLFSLFSIQSKLLSVLTLWLVLHFQF